MVEWSDTWEVRTLRVAALVRKLAYDLHLGNMQCSKEKFDISQQSALNFRLGVISIDNDAGWQRWRKLMDPAPDAGAVAVEVEILSC